MADEPKKALFVMYGAREILEKDAVYFEQQIVTIEKAIIDTPGLAIDLAYTLVDTSCKTILRERTHAFGTDWTLQQILRETLNVIPIISQEVANPTELAESVKKVINGLITTVQALSELRRLHGFASHGKDSHTQQPDLMYALLAARAADGIVNFLFRCHKNIQSNGLAHSLEYRGQVDFNDYVDEVNEPVRIFELEYKPSEVLYSVDKEAYRENLANFKPEEIEQNS